MSKRSSFGYMMRKRLSDITNSQSQSQVLFQEETILETGPSADEHVNRLMKENLALVKLLEERDKFIEVSTTELQNLRVGIHRLQVQNWSLAQSNSQFVAEINLARNKVKALQHEIMCKNALLKAKTSELERRANEMSAKAEDSVSSQLPQSSCGCFEEEAKPSDTNRRLTVRSKSMGASTTVQRSEADKAKDETKRRRLRRQSSRFGPRDQGDGENLFEIEDLELTMPPNDSHQDSSTVLSRKPNTPQKEQEQEQERDRVLQRRDVITRQEKSRDELKEVHYSYSREVPLNTKMRRQPQ